MGGGEYVLRVHKSIIIVTYFCFNDALKKCLGNIPFILQSFSQINSSVDHGQGLLYLLHLTSFHSNLQHIFTNSTL